VIYNAGSRYGRIRDLNRQGRDADVCRGVTSVLCEKGRELVSVGDLAAVRTGVTFEMTNARRDVTDARGGM
jgi:hypothetical protein